MGDLKIAMAEENNSQVDEKCCLDDEKPMNEEIQGDDVVLVPPVEVSSEVNVRRYSTGGLDKRGGASKAQVQTRYRGNQMSSTHDLCKHGKRREDDLVIKPWKVVKKKNVVESGDLVKVESLTRKSLGNVSKPVKSLQVGKIEEVSKSCDGLHVKRGETVSTPSDSAVVRKVKKTTIDVKKVSRISEKKSSKEELFKNPKNKEKTKIDELDVLEKKVSRISENKKNKGKTKIDEPVMSDDVLEKKDSRTSDNKSSTEVVMKSPKNKETIKIDEPVVCEDVLEKTLYVVEASIEKEKKKKSIKSVKSEIQQSPEKKILRGSEKKSLKVLPSYSPSSEKVKGSRVTRSDPTPIRQTSSKSKIGLPEKKEIGSATPKAEIKIRPKKIGLKVTPPPPPRNPTRQLDFKKGKVLEPKPEASSSTLLKFKKRVVQEPKLRTDVNKKKILKGVGKTSITIGEGKREKVVLRHRKVEAKKKLQTLFNNVIEETVNKLEEVKKSSKVKALVGAFETVISLQDETCHKKKTQNKTTSAQLVEG